MLLRRVIEHVKSQNWTAIAIDFVIVVVGVFIGIQVSNWNDGRAFDARERLLMQELRSEITQNMADAKSKGEAFLVGADSARRVLSLVGNESPVCADDCWSVIVDLMHASQWQQISDSWTTYDELRQYGLPSDRRVIGLVQQYKATSHQVRQSMAERPRYRTLVRGLIPIELQDEYWRDCFSLEDSIEVYRYPCPAPDGVSVDPGLVEEIVNHEELATTLREWTSIARVVGESLVAQQQELGSEILEMIDSTGTARR